MACQGAGERHRSGRGPCIWGWGRVGGGGWGMGGGEGEGGRKKDCFRGGGGRAARRGRAGGLLKGRGGGPQPSSARFPAFAYANDAEWAVLLVNVAGGRVTWLMPFAVCSRWLCVGWDCNSTSWDLFCCSGAPKGLSRLCATPSGSQYKVVLHWWLSHGCPRSPAPPRYIVVWIRVTYAECMQICRKESHAPAGPSDRTSRRR